MQQQQKIILIVDDDLTNRLVLRALIKAEGFSSIEAENGQQAVDIVSKQHVDIVLLDVMMPVMDGYAAAEIIKKNSTTFIPIIFLTALTDEKMLVKCIQSGGDDFLTKPYNHTLLRAKIESMLRIGELYKEIDTKNKELSEHNLRVQQEISLSKNLFSNVLSHEMNKPSSGLRYSMSSMSIFNGDMILAARNLTDGMDVLISDFTGHGLSAAIGSMPVADIFYTMTKKGFSFADTLAEINNKLKALLPTEMFMSAALISIDRGNNVVTVINAGLPNIYMYRDGEIVKEFKSMNIPLGISRMRNDSFDSEMETLKYGDRIFAATDGVMEAENENGEFFGVQRIINSILGADTPENIFDNMLTNCLEFSSAVEQSDDITLLELCHTETVEYVEANNEVHPAINPAQWSMQFSLDINSLRNFDIMPYIMQGVNGLQSIPNGRSTVQTILTEIFANALDHGILGLDSSIKSTPEGYVKFYQEKTERLETYDEGNIQIILSHELRETGGGILTIHVTDSGNGFDYKNLDYSLENNRTYSGRGLALVKHLCKESRFIGKGNAFMAVYEWE